MLPAMVTCSKRDKGGIRGVKPRGLQSLEKRVAELEKKVTQLEIFREWLVREIAK